LTTGFASLHMVLVWFAGTITASNAASCFRMSPQSNKYFRHTDDSTGLPELMTLRNQPRHDILTVSKYLRDLDAHDCSLTHSLLPFMAWFRKQIEQDTSGDLFSSLTVHYIGDTFVLYHCLDMLDLYRAHAQSTDEQAQDMNTAVRDVLRPLHTLHMRYLLSLVGNEIGNLGCPDADRFKYPIDKRSTEKTIQRLRESEANLDVFWTAVDAYQQEKGLSTDRLRVLLSTKTIRRTPVWKASASQNLVSTTKPEIRFLSSYYRDLQLRTEETLRQDAQPISRAKGKTKGTAQPVEQPPGVRDGDEERNEQPPPAIPLTKSTRKSSRHSSSLQAGKANQSDGSIFWRL
jgi:hypothetical protein